MGPGRLRRTSALVYLIVSPGVSRDQEAFLVRLTVLGAYGHEPGKAVAIGELEYFVRG
jgi:hypothetical protein